MQDRRTHSCRLTSHANACILRTHHPTIPHHMASTAVILTFAFASVQLLQFAMAIRPVSCSPSNRQAPLNPPHGESTLQFVNFTCDFLQSVRAVREHTRNTRRRAAYTAFVNSSWEDHPDTRPLPFASSFAQTSTAARPQVRNLSSSCFSPAAWRRPRNPSREASPTALPR